jgi:hypothetical protein
MYAIAVKAIQEGLNVPYTLEKCDYGNECQCTLEKVIPEEAKGMEFNTLSVGELTKLELKHINDLRTFTAKNVPSF